MGNSQRLGWRDFVSGTIAVFVGVLLPAAGLIISNPQSSILNSLSSIGFCLALAFVVGVPLGSLVEMVILPRFKRQGLGIALAVYLVLGWLLNVIIWAVLYAPSLFGPSMPYSGSYIAYFGITILISGICYTAVMVITRSLYPLIHRALWNRRQKPQAIDSEHD